MSGWKDHLRPAILGLEAYRTYEYRPDLVRLDANESPLGLDDADRETVAHELERLPVHRYPEVSGRPIREALARRWNVEPDEVLAGNGSDELIGVLATAFAEGPRGRGRALFPVPTFGSYESIALSRGLEPVKVPLREDFGLDEERVREAMLRERPAVALFASPNNPTGNRFDPAALERLARLGAGGVVVADEAYADFAGKTQIPLVREVEGFCVLRSLSKIGLAGLRLGALVGSRDLVAQLDKVRLPYNVNAVSMAIACALLESPGRLDHRIRAIVRQRKALADGLARIPGLTVFPSDANFVLVRTPVDAAGVWRRMLDRGVLVRYLGGGALRNCLRITAGTPHENARCILAIAAAVAT